MPTYHGESFETLRTVTRRVIEIDLEGGDCIICVEIPHPVEGAPMITFETQPVPQARKEWAKTQAAKEANRLLAKAVGLTADSQFISYFERQKAA
jgi:hypothetical protein